MKENTTISIRDYLFKKGINFTERGDELITKCIFSDCDKDSKINERHLYFNSTTGQYQCKKCGASGNIFTLAKFLGDDISAIIKTSNNHLKSKNYDFNELVYKCHSSIPDDIRSYLNKRGINDNIINKNKIGYGKFYKKFWITIPIKNEDGHYLYFKLREDLV